ncbi:MAG TPA: hypothetical protein VEC11_15225 [Allosphingosinicella sp.]|nr:hypothetical protein [Allosphingosinicella sp.]
MAFLAHLLSDALRHWLLTGLALFILVVIITWIRARRRRRRVIEAAVAEAVTAPNSSLQGQRRSGPKKVRPGTALVPLAMVAFMLFVFFGSWLTTPLIYHNGETGEGIVTGQFATADMRNQEPVVGFNVVIRKADGGIVRTSFRSDGFNVYPSANAVRYPPAGVRFNVRYLPIHPEDFVIVANDDSEWARSLRCGDLVQEVAAAQSASNLAPGDAALARARDAALAAARAGGCITRSN